MKKNNIIVLVILCIFIALIILLSINLNKKDKLNKTDTSVDDLDTSVNLDTSDEKIDWSNYQDEQIVLSKSITITEDGVYHLSGEINDGLITVNTSGDVLLILDNVKIVNNSGPAIYVESANTVVIRTLNDTENTLTDGSNYSNFDSDVEGVIYSKDDLILEGDGTLILNSNKGDAIVCKDDLKINSGKFIINSKDDAIRGKDSVYILDGEFTINAKGDGIKSSNDTENDKGYVKIENGTFNITSSLDGIDAKTKTIISGGTFDITTGGGSSSNSSWEYWGDNSNTSDSAKGIKAGDNIIITGGTYNLNTLDDAIHSNNYVGISAGKVTITSGDDGIHADKELVIDDGTIDIKKSYEGLEANTITINNGNISIVSTDDGINVAGGNDASAFGRPGEGMQNSSKSTLTINGGDIYVNASGDGLDANGSIYIIGGNVIVDGPTNSGNGALDYDAECKITGGTLIATGASGMEQSISSSSTQYGVLINFSNNYGNEDVISIVNSSGDEIMSYIGSKNFSSLVFSNSKLSKGTYTIKINGNVYQNFNIENILTTVGNSYGMNIGRGDRPNDMPGGMPNVRPGNIGRR